MTRDLLIAWLNDAYAMERAHVQSLNKYLKDFKDYLDIHSELRSYLADTEETVGDLEDTITALGGRVLRLPFKDTYLIPAENAGMYHDELVKDILAMYTAEHFGYISYSALAEAANAMEEDEVADLCERAADNKRIMADWAEEQLPAVVVTCINANAEE
ncbi:MAG TPA: DUF892 family protein [Candidatus Saccharimonadales bacterium]